MDIAGLRVRITIQKSEIVADQYGNHKSQWNDYFTCWATASNAGGKGAEETHNASSTQEGGRLDFTVRWCSETAAVNSKSCRILLDGKKYDILAIDEMGMRRKSRKFHTELVER